MTDNYKSGELTHRRTIFIKVLVEYKTLISQVLGTEGEICKWCFKTSVSKFVATILFIHVAYVLICLFVPGEAWGWCHMSSSIIHYLIFWDRVFSSVWLGWLARQLADSIEVIGMRHHLWPLHKSWESKPRSSYLYTALPPLNHLPNPYVNVFLSRINLVCPKITVRISGSIWYQQFNFPESYAKIARLVIQGLITSLGNIRWLHWPFVSHSVEA